MSDKLDSMRHAGVVNLEAINAGFVAAKPGTTLREIDEVVESVIRAGGCTPAFKGYQPDGAPSPFPATACISPNDVVVHGIPGDYTLKIGDLLTIDVGTEFEGWFVDAARSRVIRLPLSMMAPSDADKCFLAQKLVDATEAIMTAQLAVIKNECTFLRLVSAAAEVAERYGVTIMPQWGGHGIGEKIHMPPFVPNALDKNKSKIQQQIELSQFGREKFVAGKTYCIEPVTTYGTSDIMIDEDQWTIRQTEGKVAAHTERCLLVTEQGYELLS